VVYVNNHSIQEGEAEGLWVQGQCGLHSKTLLKKNKTKQNKKQLKSGDLKKKPISSFYCYELYEKENYI
jgi:hypothetical protein